MPDKNSLAYLLEKYDEELKASDVELDLSDSQRKILINIVRHALLTYLTKGRIPEVIMDDPVFSQPRATFVTLRRKENNELRGCKGEVFPTKPLYKSVQHTAISAALNDPRFPELTLAELDKIIIEISILLPIRPIKPEDVELGVHGLIVDKKGRSALFLPHVPVIYGMDKEKFLMELCIKAGLEKEAWKDSDTVLYGFKALVIHEDRVINKVD